MRSKIPFEIANEPDLGKLHRKQLDDDVGLWEMQPLPKGHFSSWTSREAKWFDNYKTTAAAAPYNVTHGVIYYTTHQSGLSGVDNYHFTRQDLSRLESQLQADVSSLRGKVMQRYGKRKRHLFEMCSNSEREIVAMAV